MIMLQPPGSEDVSKSLHQLARDGDAETIRLLFETSYAETMKYINALDEKVPVMFEIAIIWATIFVQFRIFITKS